MGVKAHSNDPSTVAVYQEEEGELQIGAMLAKPLPRPAPRPRSQHHHTLESPGNRLRVVGSEQHGGILYHLREGDCREVITGFTCHRSGLLPLSLPGAAAAYRHAKNRVIAKPF